LLIYLNAGASLVSEFPALAIRRILEQWIGVLLHAFLSYRLR
jgi:hypothetical protein